MRKKNREQEEQEEQGFSKGGKRIAACGLLIIVLFFGVGGAWITLSKITGAVIAGGEVRIDTERKTVQHLEGGIIREILVRDGDQVKEGEPLLVLDSSKLDPMIEQLSIQLMATRLRNARFEAEKTLARRVQWPKNNQLIPIPKESYNELLASAKKVFLADRESLDNSVSLLQQQKQLLLTQEKSFQERIAAEIEIVKSLKVELEAKNELFQQEYIDKTEILRIRRALSEHKGQLASLRGALAETNEKKGQLNLEIQSTRDNYRQQAITRQEQVQQQQFELEQQLLPQIDTRKRLTITAPLAGEIVAMQVHSPGGVVRSGEPLLDIVPTDSKLVVVCNIPVQDITKVHPGQGADVQLLAFNQRTTPRISGKVIYVSADRILTNNMGRQMPSYVVHIELDREMLKEENLEISAGMPASAFIRTAPRTVLDYMLEPILINFSHALRET